MVMKMSKMVSADVGKELKKRMERFPEVNWSEVIRKCIDKYVSERTLIEEMNKIKGKGEDESKPDCE